MAQNIYDDNHFFEKYIQLPRQLHGLDGTPEWVSFRDLIPDLQGAKVLDLGCGFGWLCRWARQKGAEKVHGVDVSENMLAKANEFPKDPAITYLKSDLETLELSSSTFDVVYSSLTLHYLKNLEGLVAQVYRSLGPGGSFIFSVEHPIYTSPRNPRFMHNPEGNKVWLLDGYLSEGPRVTNWLAEGVVKQHRTIASYVNILLKVGFTLSFIDEWGPSLEQIEENPSWAENRQRPMFLLIKARKLPQSCGVVGNKLKVADTSIPPNIFGYLLQLCLTPLRAKPFITTPYDNPKEIAKCGRDIGKRSFLSGTTLPERKGPRPEICQYMDPNRQTSQLTGDDMHKLLGQAIDELVKEHLAHIIVRTSVLEKSGDALLLSPNIATPHKIAKKMKREIAHIHTGIGSGDYSLHLALSPTDCKEVIIKQWGERMCLAGTLMPQEYLIIYTPRNEGEVAIVKSIVAAAIAFMTGGREFIDG